MTSVASALGLTFFSRLARPFSTSFPFFSASSESPARNAMGEKATVAAGCFWGVEHLYRKEFGSGKGLLDAKVGYCGGQTSSPSYRSVCSGTTGRTCKYIFLYLSYPFPLPLLSETNNQLRRSLVK